MATSNEMGQAAYKEANPQVSGELIQAVEKSEQAARPVAAPAREENPKAITAPKTIDKTTTILSDAMNTTHAIKGGTLTQRISQLGKTGGLEYPEYRTLSQQQRIAYLEAMSNPDYQRMARRSIQEDLERTSNISAQTKNTMTRWAADLLSFDNTEMWFGNMIATDDYADVAEMGLNVAAGATGIAATAAVGIFTPTGIAEEEPFIMGIPYSEYRDLSKEQFAEKYKEFERLDEALAKQEEIKSNVPQKKERTLGQKMVGAALRDIEYKNAVLPQGLPADAESIYTKILGGATSFGEYMAGAVAGRAIGKVGANISTKTRTSTAAAQRFKDITGKDTKLKTGLTVPTAAAKERYAGMVGGQVGSKTATALMVNDVLGSGAHESIRQYIEETGDTTLENYTGDIKKFSIDVANAAVQSWIENKWGISKFIKNPRLATKYGEWVNGFIQEFSQGEISDIAEIIKGNKTLQEALENIANNAIEGGVGSLLQGTVGTSYYMYYHKKTVSELRDIVMKQNPNLSFAQAEEFAERKANELEEGLVQDMVKDIVDFTDTNNYQGRIYETVRNNITQAIDAQRERMKDTIDGSKFDEMTEQERATYIGQVAADETDRIVVQALDEGIALSDVPQLKGQVIDGTYYLEGADYAKRTAAQLEAERQQLRDAVFAKKQSDKEAKAAATEARKAASWAEKTANMIADAKEKAEAARVKKESAQQIKESDARIKELQAEETKWQKQVEKWEKEYAKTQEKSEAAIQKDIERQTKAAIAGGNIQNIEQILQEIGYKTRDLSGTAIKQLARLNWDKFVGKNVGLSAGGADLRIAKARIEESVDRGNDLLLRQGLTQEQIDKMDDETWSKLTLAAYREENAEQTALEEKQQREEEEALEQLDLDDIPFQDVHFQEDELVVIHQTSKSKLDKILDLGGMPVPSIAITKPDADFSGFGNISLIGRKQIIDPSDPANKVFDRDVWSITFPKKTYKNAKKTETNKFRDKFRQSFIKADEENYLIDELLYYALSSARPEQAVSGFQSSLGAKIYYIENIQKEKVDVPMRNEMQQRMERATLFVKHDDKFVEEISQIDSNSSAAELEERMTPIIKALIDRFDYKNAYGEYADEMKQKAEEYYNSDNFGFAERLRLLEIVKEYNRDRNQYVVDKIKLREVVVAQLKDRESFDRWAEQEVEAMLGAPKVAVKGRLLEWNIENITKSMISRDVINQQDALVFGGGKVIAAAAKKLKSIEQIKKEAQKLTTHEQEKEVVEQIHAAMQVFTDFFASPTNSMMAWTTAKEDAYKVLAAVAQKSKPTSEDLIRELKYTYGNDVQYNDAIIKDGMGIIESVKTLARHYFEAKPQRFVAINEFAGAIIPEGEEYDNIAQRVKNTGLKVVRGTQKDGMEEFADVFFQKNRQSGKGGAYDARTRSITLGAKADATTLPHELAHYWIDKNFKYARSGRASQAWQNAWKQVEKYLGIDPEDKVLDKAASEKFSRAYERFLAEEKLPLVLMKSVADFRDFVLDHYDFDLDEARGLQDKFGLPIQMTDEIRQWFNKSWYENYVDPAESLTIDVRVEQENERSQVARRVEMHYEDVQDEAKTNNIVNEMPSGTQIQEEAGIKNDRIIGGGAIKESQGAIGQKIGATYESTGWQIQEDMVDKYLKSVSLDEAIESLDDDTYPDKIDPDFLRSRLIEILTEQGREDEAARLVMETRETLTEAAQTLQAARRLNTPYAAAINTIVQQKTEKLARAKYGNSKKAISKLDAAINHLIDKYEPMYLEAKDDTERAIVYDTMMNEAARTIGTLNKNPDVLFQDDQQQDIKTMKQLRKRGSVKAYRSRAKALLKQKLGLAPSRQQLRELARLTADVNKVITQYRKDVRDNKAPVIDPTEVLNAQNALNNYMAAQVGNSKLAQFADATNSFMMANMLWNPATQFKNIVGNSVQMIPHLLGSVAKYRNTGTVSMAKKLEIIKNAVKVQATTGYNVFSLTDFFDRKTLWAEKYYEPTTVVGKAIRAPLTLLGLSDTMFKGFVFLNHADIMATHIARSEGAEQGWTKQQIDERATELFYQALNTDPRTITLAGQKIRSEALVEGEEATFTQDSKTAHFANQFRNMLNFGKKTGVGNLLIPFTSTIANIAQDAVANWTFGTVKEAIKNPKQVFDAINPMIDKESRKAAWKTIAPEYKNLIKNVMGILLLVYIAATMGDDDEFVLDYNLQTEKDKDIRQNRNAPYGTSVRIGDKWVQIDFLSGAYLPLQTYLTARRNNFTADGWLQGLFGWRDLMPGVGEMESLLKDYQNSLKYNKDSDAVAVGELLADQGTEILTRLIPMGALANQIGNITDETKREKYNRWYDRILGRLPWGRETLPESTSRTTGKAIKQTDTWWNLLSGGNVKDYVEASVADEARYEFIDADKALRFNEASSKLKELGKDTQRYKNAVKEVRSLYNQKLAQLSQHPTYKKWDIEQKRKAAVNLHTDVVNQVAAKYGIRPKKTLKKKQKQPKLI